MKEGTDIKKAEQKMKDKVKKMNVVRIELVREYQAVILVRLLNTCH